MAKKTILHLKPSDPTRTAIVEYARHFRAALETLEVPVFDGPPPELSEAIDTQADRDAVFHWAKQYAKSLPRDDSLIIHGEMGNRLHREFWAAWALKKRLPRARLFLTIHDPPMLCSNPYRYVPTEWEGKTPFRLMNVALTKAWEERVALAKKNLEKEFLNKVEGAVILTPRGRDACAAQPLFQDTALHVLPHAFDPAELAAPEVPPKKEGLEIALFCFLMPGKGVETLLEAFQLLLERLGPPRPRLRIFGGMANKAETHKWAANLHEKIDRSPWRDSILFQPGYVENAERDRLLARADILTLPFPSTPVAFSSASLVRAMGLGKAVMAAAANTAPDLVQNGENGLLFPEGDAAALADQLERLCREPALREKLGARAAAMIRAAHSPAPLGQKLAALYGWS